MIGKNSRIRLKHEVKPYAVVIGLDSFTGLQTARLLAKKQIPVIGIATQPYHPCCRTNVCERVICANTCNYELIQALESIEHHFKYKPVLFPCSDHSVLLISSHRQKLSNWYHIVLAKENVINLMMNKDSFYNYAQNHGFPVPATFLLHNQLDAKRVALRLKYPCILKPCIRTPEWDRHTNKKVFFISDRLELLKIYDQTSKYANTLMVQEWIEGPDSNLYSCNCYFFANSMPPVTFIARKLRQWPPETGTSSLGEECRNDIVLKQSIELFEHFEFRGLGYLEIKQDSRSGKYYIIEPNVGRPTGRSAIAEAGGVDLLYTMYCDSLGMQLPRNRTQKYIEAKWIYLRRDLQSSWYYWRRGKLTLKEWIRSMKGRKFYAMFSCSDLRPFLKDIWLAAWKALCRTNKRGADKTNRALAHIKRKPI
jgi:predicted ATP-grasp superfamily ATP-dependent carboligase